ncbi:MAG: hypothetical protein Q7S01_05075 [bacterium]|nr:hypothetical protein [bacterium]
MAKVSRISFGQYDVAHLYELALEHFCVFKTDGACLICTNLKQRLEKYIGHKEVARIQRQIKKHGYCKKVEVGKK